MQLCVPVPLRVVGLIPICGESPFMVLLALGLDLCIPCCATTDELFHSGRAVIAVPVARKKCKAKKLESACYRCKTVRVNKSINEIFQNNSTYNI